MNFKNRLTYTIILLTSPMLANVCEPSKYTINVYDDTVIRYIKEHDFDGINKLIKDPKVTFTKEHFNLAKEEVINTRLTARNFRGSDVAKFAWGTTEVVASSAGIVLGLYWAFADKHPSLLWGAAAWVLSGGVAHDGICHLHELFSHDVNKNKYIKALAIQQLIANTLG